MRKLLAILATTTALLTAPAMAEGPADFYNNFSGDWHIGGYPGDPNLAPACYAEYSWQDGSTFQLIKDLNTGELYIWFQNMSWNIADAPGEYSLRMNIESRRQVNSGSYYYQLYNKNTITINFLNVDDFIPSFMDAYRINMIMPGDIPNAEVPLQGSAQATAMLAECIKDSANVKLTFPNSNTNNNAPALPDVPKQVPPATNTSNDVPGVSL